MIPLPIDSVLPELLSKLREHASVVLSAKPGAGKTTRVPIALPDADWLNGKKILMLEPRRLAASRAAEFMASQLGEKVGETIGYRMRGEAKVSARTRVEIVTEGILTRMVQAEPELPNVGVVIFDEFHERSIHADLGLALTLDVQQHLRPELRILIMSATLDGLAIATMLSGAPIVTSAGRAFPVETRYLGQPFDGQVERLVATTIARALRDDVGDLLVFLPGQREIRRVESLLQESGLPSHAVVHSLFGDAPPTQQRAALQPAQAGARKVILSTNIAETSMTIDGVRVVIDAGLSRVSRFDPRRGMSGLVTVRVSQASADQRRGRAGRQQVGVCYRLWTEAQHETLPKFSVPEILSTDLAPLALEFARWGSPNGEGLRFLDAPPAAHLSQARGLLRQLGAIDSDGKLSSHGRAMSELPVHPRLSHMLIKGKGLGVGSLACDVAALLEERDVLRGSRDADVDLHSRVHALHSGRDVDRAARERTVAQAARLRKLIDVKEERGSGEKLGVLLALAYPERIAKRRGERFHLASGALALLPERSLLAREKFLAIGDVDGAGAEVKAFLAEPLREEEIREVLADSIESKAEVRWESREKMVVAKRFTRLGAIELSDSPLSASGEAIVGAMIEGIREMGLQSLPWTKEALSLQARCEWLRKFLDNDFPNLSNEQLLATLDTWLAPFLDGVTRRSHLEKLDLSKILRTLVSYKQLALLDRLAPTHVTVPTGSRIPLDYSGEQPVLAVRLQEMFGEVDSPTVADGRVKVLLHLLSPAHRPLAVTGDLASFWKNAYPDVRKEMRGRYPKHYWAEDPLTAEPTKRRKRPKGPGG
jgi:ATP-dependent helicase HrpB